MATVLHSSGELSAWRAAHPDGVLLDVRLAEAFAEQHREGAVNNCVFEVAFAGRMADVCPDRTTSVCCVGGGAESQEARIAAEKLERLGYVSVWELRTNESGVEPGTVAVPEGRHELDPAESWVEWTGRNLLNHHRGRLGLKSGWVSAEGEHLTGGEFVIDMNAMTCLDLAGTPLHDVLIAHLKSDDFFDVERFPEAVFRLASGEAVAGAGAGGQNLHLDGTLTVKDVTAPVNFAASAGVTADGRLAAQASLAWDRTLWGVCYGSGRFFQRLGGHLVNDLVDVTVRAVTRLPGDAAG